MYKQLIIHISFVGVTLFLALSGKNRMHDNKDMTTVQFKAPVQNTHIREVASRFETFFSSQVAENTPGAAVVIVKDTNIILLKPYGVKKFGTHDSVDIRTSFRLASVSKGFAGVLTGIMVGDSAFGLNDRVTNYLPDLVLKDTASTTKLNIEHLLTHTTGLVPHAYDNLIEANISLDDIIPRLNEVDICCEPGAYYGYQNVVFSIVEKVMEASYGKTYCDLIHEKLFRPLDMQQASCDYNNFMSNPNKAEPHLGRSGNWRMVAIEPDYYHVLPAAGVNASVSDLSKWLMALLGNQSDVIDPEALELAFAPRVNTPLKYAYTRHWKNIGEKHYGLGWRIYNYYKKKIIYHGGYVKGYRAEIAICPQEDIGIAVMTNAPCRLINQSIPTFFDMYFDHEETASIKRYAGDTFREPDKMGDILENLTPFTDTSKR
ncbi:MAG: serine hydrolase [Bacteroidetes bacterium]|jgi:beta-lactamase class C|nr:serine hydrolase [Bacteroidota bacterium]